MLSASPIHSGDLINTLVYYLDPGISIDHVKPNWVQRKYTFQSVLVCVNDNLKWKSKIINSLFVVFRSMLFRFQKIGFRI